MEKHSKFLKIAVILSVLVFLVIMSGCGEGEVDPNSESTWKFINNSSYTIIVTPKHEEDTNTGEFTLPAGQSRTVTWKGHGDSYWDFSYGDYDAWTKVSFHRDYYSREIIFYNM